MKKFEYKVTTRASLTNGNNAIEAFDDGLDSLGREGWELAAVHNHELIFKREMQPLDTASEVHAPVDEV